MIVLDASAAVEWLLRLPRAEQVEQRLLHDDPTLHAPHLIDVEVAQVVRRLTSAGLITASRGKQALEDLADLDLERHPHEILLPAVWRLRENMTAYDGVYVALAEALDAPLVTLDARLASAPGHGARIDAIDS